MLRNKARSLATTAAKRTLPEYVVKNLQFLVEEVPLVPKQPIGHISFGTPGPLQAGARVVEEVHAFAKKEFWRERHAWSGGPFNAGSHKSSFLNADSSCVGVSTRAFGLSSGSWCGDASSAGSWALRCSNCSKLTETAGATSKGHLGPPPPGRIQTVGNGGSLQRCFANQPQPSSTAQTHTPKPSKPPQPSESHSGSSGGAGGAGEHGQKTTGSSRFWKALTALQAVPLVPLVLGFAGAIPFVALSPPVAPLLPLPEELQARHAEAQAAYGAVILSFLGAVHWGMAMAGHAGGLLATFTTSSVRYVWGVTPSLLAWSALLLQPAECFAALAASLGLVFLVDAGFTRLGLLPAWYLPLRLPLTIAAVASLLSSWSVAAAQTALIEARKKLTTPQPKA